MTKIDSTDDQRTENSPVRHQYRVLSDHEKAQMTRLKDIGAAFIRECEAMGGGYVNHEAQAHRDLSLAVQHAEDAVMRAVRHLTA